MKLYNALLTKKFTWSLVALYFFGSWPTKAIDNMTFKGTLVAEPCIIQLGDTNIHLDFFAAATKQFYLNKRTTGQVITINLSECDLDLGNSVKLTFIGNESSKLPGFLALDNTSGAAGIAIGIETMDGQPVAINSQLSSAFNLKKGTTQLNLKAYLQSEPEALANQNIVIGDFSAGMVFSLEYQ